MTVCQWEIFNYIHNLLSMPGYSHEEKQRVKSKVLKHIRVSAHTHTHSCALHPGAYYCGRWWVECDSHRLNGSHW